MNLVSRMKKFQRTREKKLEFSFRKSKTSGRSWMKWRAKRRRRIRKPIRSWMRCRNRSSKSISRRLSRRLNSKLGSSRDGPVQTAEVIKSRGKTSRCQSLFRIYPTEGMDNSSKGMESKSSRATPTACWIGSQSKRSRSFEGSLRGSMSWILSSQHQKPEHGYFKS